jgi:hypothetical protein
MTEFHGALTMLSSVLAPAFFDVLGLAALGVPLLAAAAEILGRVQRKAFLDRFAQHLTVMGFGLLALVLIVAVAGAGLAALRFPEIMARLHAPGSPLFPFYGALAAVLAFHGLYRFGWSLPKGPHLLLGLLAGLSSLTAIFLSLPALRGFALLLTPEAATAPGLVPSLGSPFWPCLVQYVALAPALAGAMGLLFLVHRRDRDNYGRDYYAFSMRLAARWAALSVLPALLAQPWVLFSLEPGLRALVLVSPTGLLWALAVLLMLLCAGLWWAVAKSGSPMRLKGLMLGSALLAWLFHSLLLALAAELFFS